MSVQKFEDAIKISINSYNRARLVLPKKLGNAAVSHFKDNWRKQGYDDNIVKPWKPRKGQIKSWNLSKKSDSSRAILVKSGRLRRSFDVLVQSPIRVLVENDAPYGIYHNYGTKKLPQRKFMGKSKNLDEKSGVLIMKMIKAAL